MGAIDFIQKPYSRDHIARAVESIRRTREKNLRKAAKKAAEEAEEKISTDEGELQK